MDLSSDLKKAKRGAIAKAISIVENDEKESRKLIKKIFKTSGKSMVIGITGPAGAGKSSLIDKTSIQLKKLGMKPAVLAIDPTSHISGGAILGDRVRMTESTDSGTYIRSLNPYVTIISVCAYNQEFASISSSRSFPKPFHHFTNSSVNLENRGNNCL